MDLSIAHIRQSDGEIQTVEQHLLDVKLLAESYGEKIGIKHITGLAGMLHDMGKYNNEFKEYILEAVKNPLSPPKRGSVDHSTAGGKLLYEVFHHPKKQLHSILSEVVGNSIISHHSYLHDFLNTELESNFLKRVSKKELNNYQLTKDAFFAKVMSEKSFHVYVDRAVEELKKYLLKNSTEGIENNLMFLTKFVFSTLIDADRTNTRLFEENAVASENYINHIALFERYYAKLIQKINSFKTNDKIKNPINQLRQEMSDQCEKFATKQSGIYTLSIPTGGGKTLASLRYALKHAIKYDKKRIIYVVPYTTIIEQNAEVVRKILQDDENVLEHHSNIIDDDENDEYLDGIAIRQQKLKLAKDNWDSPIIFTTMVQFMNSFYAYGSRNIRRLHNLCESVIIFDEVQKVPIHCVSLFNRAVNFLKNHGKSSVILCTATQPALDFVKNKLQINNDAEIISDLKDVINAFKRVDIIDRATEEKYDTERLAQFIQAHLEKIQNVMVVLNTKSVVKKLYEKLKEMVEIPVFHLSTSMCAAHRKEILDEIREKLNKREKIICVSTQLIEAGVDISFECVVRSLAGLDSIAQAAGRCNRHGERKLGTVYVIDHLEEKLDRLKEIKVGKEVAARILTDMKYNNKLYDGNLLSAQAMNKYFQEFYYRMENELDYRIPKLGKNMLHLLTESKRDSESYHQGYKAKFGKNLPLFIANSYKTAAEYFQVIESNTTSVIVPFGYGKEIILELNGDGSIENLTKLLRMAQQYTVNLYKNEFDQLAKNNGIVSFYDGKIFAITEGAYSREFGINIQNDSSLEGLFI
ncbi:CRISPR-associated helicase/endonuclease Cas3 [Bacillus kwashiorkori]|uniref:CRISPR-associated helicase/endonuclease Cas3 n=1 Tax=Bacillus kwashiorkori TaxID=1522318 RepID=UPI0007814C52|nr:CRISPR-associated helicase/endonuclease Cas3 [Bacillus kwashiorkori]